MAIYLGIDVGTSSVKTIAIDEIGQVIASAAESYPMAQPRAGWAEQDPTTWWVATESTIRAVIQTLGASKRTDIAGIGLSGQMHSLVLLDEENVPLRPAILWCDQRTDQECQEITRLVGSEALRSHTGNRALTGFTAPKILWVQRHEPQLYGRIRHVLLPKDFIRFHLTGDFATEVSDASGTLLLDVQNRQWSDAMLSALDIPKSWMPRVYESVEITGRVTRACAERTGLPEGIPVVGGGGDQAAGAVGTGVVQEGDVSVALGTSGVVFAFQRQYDVDSACRLHTFCHAVTGAWHTMGVMLSATGSLDWWREAVGHEETRRAQQIGGSAYELLCDPATDIPAGSDGLLFVPYLMGERTPHPDPMARGAFIGLTRSHEKAHMTRSIMEGVAFGLRDSLEIMKDLSTPVDQIRVTGGGAKSTLWRQIVADVMQKPVVTVTSSEGPAYGVALLAAVASGSFASTPEACTATIRQTSVTEPSPATRVYESYYGIYREVYGTLKSTFHSLTTLSVNE